jgi:predicted O-methyltransferase YrrM
MLRLTENYFRGVPGIVALLDAYGARNGERWEIPTNRMGAFFADLAGRLPAGAVAPAAPAPVDSWPLLARMVAKAATASEWGVGDTVARCLHLVGADSLANAYKLITGTDCGCADRRAKLNALYPYEPDLTIGGGCGNGDIALAAWIAEGHKRDGRRVAIVCRDGYAQIARMFGQHVTDRPGKVHLRLGNGSRSYADELRQQLRTPRAVQWQAELPWQSEPTQPPVSIPEAEAKAADAFLKTHNPEGRPVIVLYPISAQVTRRWPLSCWLDLAWRLAAQYCVVTLDGPGSEDVKAFPLWYQGPSWYWQGALMKRAALVIGNDSAGVHLAVTIGTPAIALMGPTRAEVVFGHAMPHVIAGSTDCTGCHFSRPYSAACDKGCRSLFSVSVDQVLEGIQRIPLPAAPVTKRQFAERFGAVAVPQVDAWNFTSDEEAGMLAAMIHSRGCRRVLEIGTADGRTAAQVLGACPSVEAWQAVDIDPKAGGVCHDARYRLWLRSGRELPGCGYDCIFVDGDHSYAAVMADTAEARKLLAPGGLLVWHDAANVADVDRALNELRAGGIPIRHISGTRLAWLDQ